MIANFHTHTYRCGHAVGSEEEYIKNAIVAGFKTLGFSDHAPFVFPDGSQSSFRIQSDAAEDYFNVLKALRQKYKDEIGIYIGFEMEYYPNFFDDMLSFAKSLGAEYLILGQHFIGDEYPAGKPSGKTAQPHTSAQLSEYVDCAISGLKTGCFTYLAHPDLFYYDFTSQEYKTEITRLCREVNALQIPLEINLYGIADNRHYPNVNFWKIAGECGCKAILGSDAHAPDFIYRPDAVEKALKLAKDNGIELLDTVKIKRI